MRTWPSALAFGGDYNPEQWPAEIWREDVELMRRAGVTMVTVGVFAWSWLEPEPGRYEFGWLDEVLGLLADADIAVDLATATASPPPWFSQKYPQTLPVDRNGVRYHPGSRQAWCPSSTIFTEHATALASQLARRYHGHPSLGLWHVGNEYGCHNLPCCCDVCAEAFRQWLIRRYADLDAVNAAWGTAFWSQRITDWSQIGPPRATPTIPNPTRDLDYWRFQSDQLLAQFVAERDVLHQLSPGVPVTTNFMTGTGFRGLDYPRWATEVDVISTDHYVVHSLDDPQGELSFAADRTRGLAGGQPWLLMEHSSSAVNWQPVNVAKSAGQLLRDSLAHVAHGADMLGFFQWRASSAGAEKWHSALLPHAGQDTKIFRESCELGAICGRLGELTGSIVQADVALLYDDDACAATGLPAHPSSELDYATLALDLHRTLAERGLTVDVVPPPGRLGGGVSADLSRYQVIIVPTLYLCSDETAASIAAAAHAGAQVLISYFSGIVDVHDHVTLAGYPGAFRDLLGVRIEEFFPLRAGEGVVLDDGTSGSVWSELGRADRDVEVLTRYAHGPCEGSPATTRRLVGAGGAWYLGTRLDRWALVEFVDLLCVNGNVTPPIPVPRGVEVTRRVSAEASRQWTFVINHLPTAIEVPLVGRDLVRDAEVELGFRLDAGAVAVIRQELPIQG